MSNYAYVAIDAHGTERRGTLEVADQSEALQRIKQMGLFPTKVMARHRAWQRRSLKTKVAGKRLSLTLWGTRVKASTLTVFTRQLATLLEAGMPLLRGLRILQEQETEGSSLRRVIGELALGIENGGSLSEALAVRPGVFDDLYVNMVKAGEISGALDVALTRLAELLEKSRRIKGRVKSAMYYPACVLIAALGLLTLMMVFVVPRFQAVFEGLLGTSQMPAFTRFVLQVSEMVKNHLPVCAVLGGFFALALNLGLRTGLGRRLFDQFKLAFPLLGPVFRKAAISRFSRTLGTLAGNGVPILQALTIVRQTAGNVVVGRVIASVHDRVKEGDAIAPAIKDSGVFPAMVAGMVDIGEQSGALPEMLMKIADTYDEEVDTAVNSMSSLLEPILILFLAVIVGSIVIAMFLPLFYLIDRGFDTNGGPRID